VKNSISFETRCPVILRVWLLHPTAFSFTCRNLTFKFDSMRETPHKTHSGQFLIHFGKSTGCGRPGLGSKKFGLLVRFRT